VREQRTKNRFLSSYFCLVIFVFCLLVFATGCESPGSSKAELTEQIETLKDEAEQCKDENKQLKKRIQVLSGLPEQVRPKNVYDLKKIKITKYTNLYDKDEDGKKEKLIVYIQPIDRDGDVIKAAGAVDVQLWDLNREDGQAMLGQWHVEPDELRELWFATLITINYRLVFDVAGKVDEYKEPLTVKVTFTDYLSGKVFKEQAIIKPLNDEM